MKAKAKKTPTFSVSLIAIELKALAAPGEALKNNRIHALVTHVLRIIQAHAL